MTDGAQQALRRTMEIYSQTTRFALACNNSEKIIEAIQSRCAVLRYGKLTDEQILKKVLQVCKQEDVRPLLINCLIHEVDSNISFNVTRDCRLQLQLKGPQKHNRSTRRGAWISGNYISLFVQARGYSWLSIDVTKNSTL